MRKYNLLFLLALTLLQGCFNSDLTFEDQFEPVVEAFLFKDRMVEDIRVSSMYSFGNDTTIGGQNIIDALVELRLGDESWQLLPDQSDSGMYYLDEFIQMEAGDTFEISVSLEDIHMTAKTLIPEDPPLVTMSETSVGIQKVYDMQDFRNVEMPDPVVFTWDNPELKYYFFRVQNIESTESPIMPDPPDDMPFKRPNFFFQMDTKPVNDNYFELSMRELTHFGTHQIIVYGVNDEYVSLYNSIDQDTRELNEPFSNIENGLGIFTAFSSDTMYLEVYPVY